MIDIERDLYSLSGEGDPLGRVGIMLHNDRTSVIQQSHLAILEHNSGRCGDEKDVVGQTPHHEDGWLRRKL